MIDAENIRWKQRFSNYQKAYGQLRQALAEYDDSAPNIVKEGILQRFEFTHELAWNTLRNYLEYEGHQNITGSRSATRLAFNLGLITNGQIWMDMIESRNRTVHAYDEKLLEQEYRKVRDSYADCFEQLLHEMRSRL